MMTIHPITKSPAEKVALIKSEVANWFGIKPHVLYSRIRPEHIAWPRQIAMNFAAEYSGVGLVSVGAMFGRDHGTIIHAMKRVSDRCHTEPATEQNIEALRSRIVGAIQ